MNTENENINIAEESEDKVTQETKPAEEINDDEKVEDIEETAEADKVIEEQMDIEAVEREIMEEFAPKPIEIPNYDKEKEQKKREKAKQKKKGKKSKKAKKRKKMVKKILNVIMMSLLALLLVVITIVTVAALIVRLNTSEYAVENAINDSRPEMFTIGNLSADLRGNLILVESSPEAGLADIIRDNTKGTVRTTYSTIEAEVKKSTYPEFVASVASEVIGYYLYGNEYSPLTRKEISDVVAQNSSKIDFLTGRKLYRQQCDDIATSVLKSKAVQELSAESLNNQPTVKITTIASAILSLPMLIGMVVALLLLIILVIILCGGYSHKIIGAAFIIAGALSGTAGFLYKPMFNVSSKFINCVIDAIVQSFNKNSLICGVCVLALGVLVIFIGSAFTDREEFIEEDDYIDGLDPAEESK